MLAWYLTLKKWIQKLKSEIIEFLNQMKESTEIGLIFYSTKQYTPLCLSMLIRNLGVLSQNDEILVFLVISVTFNSFFIAIFFWYSL